MEATKKAAGAVNPDGPGQRNGEGRRSTNRTQSLPRNGGGTDYYRVNYAVPDPTRGRLLVPTQMAARLGCSDALVRDLIDRAIEGQPHGIPGVKSGSRYYCAEGAFENWLRGHRHQEPAMVGLDGDVGKLLEVALAGALDALKTVRGRS